MIRSVSKHLTLLAAATLAVGCATSGSFKSKEDLVIAAGFKAIKPVKPDQKAILEKLPNDKITRITYSGKPYYVLPDKADGQAYVGGAKQYQVYQELGKGQEQALEYDQDVNAQGRDKSHKGESSAAAELAGWDGWKQGWSSTDGQTD